MKSIESIDGVEYRFRSALGSLIAALDSADRWAAYTRLGGNDLLIEAQLSPQIQHGSLFRHNAHTPSLLV